jgi:hypothetical protein
MTDFVNAAEVRPLLHEAMIELRDAVKYNQDCSPHILMGVIQLLLRIYYLPIGEEPGRFTLPPQGEMDELLDRLRQWVLQWSQRGPIDDAIDLVRLVFRDTVAWSQRNNIQNNADQYTWYIHNSRYIFGLSNRYNLTVPHLIRRARQH